MAEIKVKVVEFGDRKHYQMQYVDPVTRKKKTRSTGVVKTSLKKDRTEAERVAAKWEAELREGRYSAVGKVSWAAFRERYENEVLSGLSVKSLRQCDVVFGIVESMLGPNRVADVTANRLSWLAAELRKDERGGKKGKLGLSESTIKSYLAHLKSALRWAERVGIISKAPVFPVFRRAQSSEGAKGRALTGEEFERLLDATPKVVGVAKAPEWCRFLSGLWWSGFRIGEALSLSWDQGAGIYVEVVDGEAVAHITAASQKSNRNEVLPLAPEFGEMLDNVPVDKRKGYVFEPLDGNGNRIKRQAAIRTIGKIGRQAKVKTWSHPKSGKPKFVTAHDLRRSFGTGGRQR